MSSNAFSQSSNNVGLSGTFSSSAIPKAEQFRSVPLQNSVLCKVDTKNTLSDFAPFPNRASSVKDEGSSKTKKKPKPRKSDDLFSNNNLPSRDLIQKLREAIAHQVDRQRIIEKELDHNAISIESSVESFITHHNAVSELSISHEILRRYKSFFIEFSTTDEWLQKMQITENDVFEMGDSIKVVKSFNKMEAKGCRCKKEGSLLTVLFGEKEQGASKKSLFFSYLANGLRCFVWSDCRFHCSTTKSHYASDLCLALTIKGNTFYSQPFSSLRMGREKTIFADAIEVGILRLLEAKPEVYFEGSIVAAQIVTVSCFVGSFSKSRFDYFVRRIRDAGVCGLRIQTMGEVVCTVISFESIFKAQLFLLSAIRFGRQIGVLNNKTGKEFFDSFERRTMAHFNSWDSNFFFDSDINDSLPFGEKRKNRVSKGTRRVTQKRLKPVSPPPPSESPYMNMITPFDSLQISQMYPQQAQYRQQPFFNAVQEQPVQLEMNISQNMQTNNIHQNEQNAKYANTEVFNPMGTWDPTCNTRQQETSLAWNKQEDPLNPDMSYMPEIETFVENYEPQVVTPSVIYPKQFANTQQDWQRQPVNVGIEPSYYGQQQYSYPIPYNELQNETQSFAEKLIDDMSQSYENEGSTKLHEDEEAKSSEDSPDVVDSTIVDSVYSSSSHFFWL